MRSSGDAPLLVVATFRDPKPGSPLGEALGELRREPGVERLVLRGLDEVAVGAYLAAARGESLDEAGLDLARPLHAETEGNAFFVSELVRHLADAQAQQATSVPQGVREVVRARVARRSPICQRALTQAAVVGARFSFQLLDQLVSDDGDDLLDALEEAEAARLLVAETQPGHYRFAHAIVRDALYAELGATRRVRMHRAVGEALETLDGPTAATACDLAFHFCAAAPLGGGPRGLTTPWPQPSGPSSRPRGRTPLTPSGACRPWRATPRPTGKPLRAPDGLGQGHAVVRP